MSDLSVKTAPGSGEGPAAVTPKPPADTSWCGRLHTFFTWLTAFFSLCFNPGVAVSAKHSRDTEMVAALRVLRTEVLDLIFLLRRIKNGQLKYSEGRPYLKKTYQDIDDCIASIVAMDEASGVGSDAVRHILNLWEQMKISRIWPANSPATPPGTASAGAGEEVADTLQVISLLEEQAQGLVLEVGYRTIVDRVNAWLKLSRPGHVLPFHMVFEDELLNEADRVKVLNYITWKQEQIQGGLVDPSTGLIYRYPSNPFSRALRHVFVILVLLSFTALFWKWGAVMAWLEVSTPFLASAAAAAGDSQAASPAGIPITIWLALLAGLLAHKLVGSAKHRQGVSVATFLPVSDWGYFLSARTAQIVGRVALSVFVTAWLLLMAEEPGDATINYAFLAGYGLDSFAGLFASNLERQAGAQAEALRGRYGLNEDGKAARS